MIRQMTSQEYIEFWSKNAKQHFDDGDYEWICDKIRQIPSEKPINRLLEVGCGSGWSTLTFILRDFELVSIDANEVAIRTTKELIEANDYFPAEESVKLLQADVVHDFKSVREELDSNPVDLIVLCNPGGSTKAILTKQEKKWLDWGNFSEDEYYQENLPQLHTYSMIYACCGLSSMTETPLLIVQRDTREEILETLQRIGSDGNVRLINHCLRQIRRPPEGGVTISGEGDLYWGMGLFFP